ncbi:MAG: hypothetical protein VB089_16900 [Anaerolineaceae bacterium]|nr:hypothetical protein [Anaerolineaceae bacterium]
MERPSLYCSGELGRIFLDGVQEVIGGGDLHAILEKAGIWAAAGAVTRDEEDKPLSYEQFTALQQALEESYGSRAGHGIALRAGRSAYRYLLRQFTGQLGVTGLEYRLLPTPNRLHIGLQSLARTISNNWAGRVSVQETDLSWVWTLEDSPWSRQPAGDEPVCHFVAGMVQEFMAWVSGGRFYPVNECQPCEAAGCRIEISKQPID